MNSAELQASLVAETNIIASRARNYVLVRLAVDLMLLSLAVFEAPTVGVFPVYWLLAIDILALLLYWLAVRRWPAASTYFSLLLGGLLLIAADFSLGEINLLTWFFLIPLGLTGGLIVARAGFNSLITVSFLLIFGIYGALIYVGRVPLPLAIPRELFVTLGAAIGVVVIVLNALIETLVVYLFQAQQNLVLAEVQLLQARTELEKSRSQLSHMQSQTRHMERISAIGQIAGQVSKLLRRPLTASQALLATEADGPVGGQNNQELRRLLGDALRITDGLAHFASIGRMQVKTVNLDDILADEISHVPAPPDVRLELDLPPVFPPIQADPDHMRLLCHHLLDNAYQAVHEQGGAVTVTLAPAPEGIRLKVSDDGPGIPPDQLELIFEPLFTTQEEGFGLGLSICQQVVHMHGGRIRVESVVGKGTTFTIYLPRVPRQLPEELAQDVAG